MEMLGFEEVLMPFVNKANLTTQARHLLLPEWIEDFTEMRAINVILNEVINRDSFKPITDKLGIPDSILIEKPNNSMTKKQKAMNNP